MGRRASNCHLLLITPVYLILIVVASLEVACLMMSEPSADPLDEEEGPGSEANQNSDCDLQDCLELYQAAQDSIQARHDGLPSSRHHSGSVGIDSRAARCTVLRTFFLCIRNMSKSCLGDLTFHSSHRVVQKQMRDSNCSQRGPVFRPPVAIPPITGGFPMPSEGCTYHKETSHQFCTVFGDPHVRTFDGTHQTCRVIGAFPMLDNEFLSIQVTSEAVNSAGASAIAKVTVVIKRHDECVGDRYVTYQAISPDPLPSTFDNGLSSFGTSDTVQLIDVTAGQHVEIIVRHAATTVVLRQSGRFFSISVRVPDDLVQKSLGSVGTQLCVMKCPAAERLSLSAIESLSTFAFADALNICRRHKLVDFFLDACVFDLVASGGDRNFTSAAVHALHDFRRLVPINASHLRSWTAFPGPNVSSCTVRLLSLKSLDYLLALFAIISLYLYWTVSLLLFSQMGCSCRSVTSHCATHPMSR